MTHALALALWLAAAPQGEVTLPLQAYRDLVERSSKRPSPAEPPAPFSIRQASYHVTTQGRLASILMRIQLDVMNPEPVVVPLMGSGAALRATRLGGQPAGAFVADNHYALMLPRGSHRVEMEGVVPVASEGPSAFSLPVPAAVTAFLTAELPPGTSVAVEGVPNVSILRQARKTLVSAALPVTTALAMSWVLQAADDDPALETSVGRDGARDGTPGKARATVHHHVAVEETLIRGLIRASFLVQNGTRAQLAITLPGNVEVLDVQAPDLREWNATAEGPHKRVNVSLRYARGGEIPLTVRYERSLRTGGAEATGERTVVEIPAREKHCSSRWTAPRELREPARHFQ
jgi:hypothetical protein